MASERRRLAAIISADVAGYSRLMGRDESGTLAALKALRNDVIDPKIAAYGGRIVKTTGDGLLLEFPSVVDAVRCVVEVQTAMAAKVADVPKDRMLAFRIGVHVGDIIIDGDDIFGDGVNIAARLQDIATPGGLCVSGRVYDDVSGRLDATFEDGGTQQLKNIARPIQIWRWMPGLSKSAGISANFQTTEPPLTLPDKPSIAVLPFQNISGDSEQEQFTDGIAEDIITELSRFRSLFVIARNSSFSYKGKSPDFRQVGRELGVRYVLQGSVRKASNRIRVTVQLIDTDSGDHIWAERYDSILEDVFAIQEEITRAIVGAIAPQIEWVEQSMAVRSRPENLSAYEIALRAYTHAWEGNGNTDQTLLEQSIREAKEALTIDPNSVLALHALTFAQSLALFLRLTPKREYALREAIDAVTRAIQLEKRNPYGYALRALGILLGGQLDRYSDALVDARQAYEMNPNDVHLLRILGYVEAAVGDHELAIERAQQVLRLSPFEHRNHETYNLLAFASFGVRRYVEQVQWASRAIDEMPRTIVAHWNLVTGLVGAGEINRARAAFSVGSRLSPDFFKVGLEGQTIYATKGDNGRAVTFLRIAADLEDPRAAEALR